MEGNGGPRPTGAYHMPRQYRLFGVLAAETRTNPLPIARSPDEYRLMER